WTALAWAPDDRTVVVAGADRRLYQWELSSGQVVRRFARHDQAVQAVAFSPDSTRLASVGWSGAVRLWDAETGSEVGHWEGLNSVTVVGANGLLAPQHDRQVVVRDTQAQQGPEALAGHAERVRAVAASRDGKLWATGGDDGQVFLWDADTKKRR